MDIMDEFLDYYGNGDTLKQILSELKKLTKAIERIEEIYSENSKKQATCGNSNLNCGELNEDER